MGRFGTQVDHFCCSGAVLKKHRFLKVGQGAPESTVQGGVRAISLVWAAQLTVTKHHLLICNKQITEDCNTVTPEPQTADSRMQDLSRLTQPGGPC